MFSGVFCEGYFRPRIFINSNQRPDEVGADGFAPKAYSQLSLARPKSQFSHQRSLVSLSPPTSSISERSLDRSASESNHVGFYWTSLLPNGQVYSAQATRYSSLGWAGVVQDLWHQHDLVRLALLANALGLLGQHSGQQAMIMEGWRMYGRSLQLLAKLLPAMSKDKADILCTTSMLLAQYEVRLSSGVLADSDSKTCLLTKDISCIKQLQA